MTDFAARSWFTVSESRYSLQFLRANDPFLKTQMTRTRACTTWMMRRPLSRWVTGTTSTRPRPPLSVWFRRNALSSLSYPLTVYFNSTLINGKGRYIDAFGENLTNELAVVNVKAGTRYRMRLISMSCDPVGIHFCRCSYHAETW